MKTMFHIVCALSLMWIPGAAQRKIAPPPDTLARIGTAVITSRDVMERLELMPYPGKDKPKQIDSVKVKALLGMVAEKVLANEARRLNIAEDAATRRMRLGLEDLLVRDELYRREVIGKATASEAEIHQGMERYPYEYRLLVFTVASEQEGLELMKTVQRKPSPDSILYRIPGALYSRIDTIKAGYGTLEPDVEDIVYGIGRTRISKPYHAPVGAWFVFYVLDRTVTKAASEMDAASRHMKVEKIIKKRKEQVLATALYKSLLQARRADADERMFRLFADSIVALWKEDTARFRTEHGFALTSDVVDLLAERLAPYLDSVIVRIDDGDLTLGSLLEMFRYENYYSAALEGEPFLLHLNETIRMLVGAELLSREGKQQNLQNAPAVRRDMQRWSDYWAAGALFNKTKQEAGITDEEVMQHFLANRNRYGRMYEVNIREVLCADLNAAAGALAALQTGEPMASIARRMTQRKEWKERGGESGYVSVRQYPELGFRALAADTGTLLGPVKLPEGYSLFTVLGKRAVADSMPPFDALAREVKGRMLAAKQRQALNTTIADLARKQNVSVRYDLIKRMDVKPIQMFTRRYIGFGGTMTAVPMLMQQFEWYLEFQKHPDINP